MNGWKITAIIFMVLFVLETVIVGWMIKGGTEMEGLETECAVNVCGNIKQSTSYYFDWYSEICYCINQDSETIREKYMGGS